MARAQEFTTYVLVFEDGRAVKSQVVKGCERDAFRKLTVELGRFDAYQVDEAAFPRDDEFRHAWTFSGGTFGHDMARAREIHRNRLRAARKPLLDALDTQFIRAMEAGTGTAEIVAAKNRLRDAPADPRIDAAKTVAELRAVTL